MKVVLVEPATIYVAEIERCASDPKVSTTCNVPHPYPVGGALHWTQRILGAMRERKSAVFFMLTEGAFSGVISLNRLNREAGTAELDYWVAGEHQGRGVGTEAVRLVMKKAVDEFRLRVLFSACLITNPASSRILEKNGFRETRRLINQGQFGLKFINQEMRRLRKDLCATAKDVSDPLETAE